MDIKVDIQIVREVPPTVPVEVADALELVALFRAACGTARRMGMRKAEFLEKAPYAIAAAWAG